MRNWRRIRAFVAVLGSLALVAAACGPTAPTGGTPGGTAGAQETPQQGGRIVEGTFADIKTLSPTLSNDVPSSTAIGKIYDTLFTADPKSGELKPNLGKWQISSDSRTYTWEIDSKANWSDGKPIIGEDYLTGVKAVAKSKLTVRKSNYQDIEGWKDFVDGKAATISGIKVDSANPKKFTVTFTKVFCPALVNAFGTSSGPLPTHVFGKYVQQSSADEIDKAPENLQPTVFSGPFKFKEWRKGDQVIMDRNESYWKGAPLVDQWVYKVVADSTVLAAQLKTGELNYGTIDPKDLADMETQPNLQIFKYQQLSYTYIGWNVKSATAPALADKKVRQALAYGLDMDAVVKSILFGQGTKMVAHHPPVSWAFPKAGMQEYKYDKAKAEQLIKEAGYTKSGDFYAKDGKTLEFSIVANSGNKVREQLLQVATEQYKAIGVKVNPKLEAFETMVDKLTKGNQEIQAWIIGWSLGLEPDPYGIWHSSQIPDPGKGTTGFNFGAFTAPGFDKAIEDGRSGDCSQAARQKNYETVNKILNEEQPYNFGFSPNALLVVPKNMRAIDPGPFSTTYNIEKWWYKK
ncbi:MAG TPA: ABC transporter substrate-binding protein [Candidatus Limnocylindria bacterium]|nr:ABC transporter substrate-binding protein [Candidatus Limnocylindria bacterium]